MASIRRGYSDDFTLKNNSVGIGTSTGQEALDVVDGAVKGQDLKVTGISSFTAYEGFLRADQQIAENTTLSFDQGPVSSLSGEIIVETGKTVTINEVVKETAGVGNGTSQWNDLNGNVAFSLEGDTKWNGSSFFDLDGTGDFFYQRGGGTDGFTFGTGDFAIEQWVYITTTGQQHFYEARGSTSTNTILIYVDSSTILKTYLNGSNAIADSGALTQNVWHHIVLTRSSGTTTLYKNGTSVGTYSDSLNYVASPQGIIYFGSNAGTDGLGAGRGSYVTGRIGITRTYKGRALTLAEVTSNYNAGYTATTSAVAATVDLNPNNPASYPGTVRAVDTTDVTRAGGSEVECLKVFNTFTPPSGGTNERPYAPKPGELYYNYDFKTIEFYDGYGWRQVDNRAGSGRGYFAGGTEQLKRIATVLIQTLGSATNFGELENGRQNGSTGGALSSSTRALVSGGYIAPNASTDIDYFTLTSGGTAVDFGNLRVAVRNQASCASSTRGLFGGGEPGPTAEITYVEISTKGDSLNFGDMTVARHQVTATSSPTRGVFLAGAQDFQVMDYVIIASKGDAIDFGDLSQPRDNSSGVSNGVRGVIGSGFAGPAANVRVKTMDYITFASQGNAIDFGERTQAADCAATCDSTRGIFKSDYAGPSPLNTNNLMDYITIASAGDAVDWGDFVDSASQTMGNMSDSHGGLGGF